MKLSICIPTYNRAAHLANCLQSIAENWSSSGADVQICVSDNCSTDETESVVRSVQERIPIKYVRNVENLGIAKNFLAVVAMADGDFVWMIGDDDLLLPGSIQSVLALIDSHPAVDYFFVNSSHLTTEYVFSFPQPFHLRNLPESMEPFSARTESGEMRFLELIDPEISFDFLLGMFLSVFRREMWNANIGVLDPAALADERTFSHFDNTCPHVKIFAAAFAGSNAYFCATPRSVCLTGARSWAPMYPMITSVRLIESLEQYRKNGLPYFRYLRCRNFALRTFLPDLAYMLINRSNSGLAYVNPWKLFLVNALYPNTYLSPLYYMARKASHLLSSRSSDAAARFK